jgi:single stranded DNA-binding protein
MANLNRVLLMGRLTRDPEIRYTPKGTATADLGLAINRALPAEGGGERREETTFADVTLWVRRRNWPSNTSPRVAASPSKVGCTLIPGMINRPAKNVPS